MVRAAGAALCSVPCPSGSVECATLITCSSKESVSPAQKGTPAGIDEGCWRPVLRLSREEGCRVTRGRQLARR